MHDLSWNGALKPIFIRQQAWKILMGSPYLPSASNPFSLSQLQIESFQRARGVVVSHPLSMREALGSIPSVSMDADMRAAAVHYICSSGIQRPGSRCVSRQTMRPPTGPHFAA